MRGVSWWLTLGLLLSPLSIYSRQSQWFTQVGSSAAQVPTQNPAQRHTITGTVTNAITGEPVRRALVQLWGPQPINALTGPDGRFQIDDVPEGQAHFNITKPGFIDSLRAEPTQFFTVGSGSNDFHLKLTPAAKIVGRLTDQDDEPIEQAPVQVIAQLVNQGHKQWQPRNGSSTDDDGSYRIDDLPAGRYVVYVGGRSLMDSGSTESPDVIPPAYYPNGPELDSAQVIELQPGDEFHADFHLQAQRGFRVSGTIAGCPPSLAPYSRLENESGQMVSFAALKLDPGGGHFVIQPVPSGKYTLTVDANDREGHIYEARQEIVVDGEDINNLHLVLHPSASIAVSVNRPANQVQGPIIGAMGAGAMIWLKPAGGTNRQQFMAQPNGNPASLSINNIVEGQYVLSVQTFGNECVESAWYGNVDLSRDYVVVGADGATQRLTINLTSNCATLSAKVDSGDAHPPGFAVVVPSDSVAEPKILGLSSSPGPFSGPLQTGFLTLAPGSYQVYGFTTLDGVEYANPQVLRDYVGQVVDLTAGQKTELTLKLNQPKAN